MRAVHAWGTDGRLAAIRVRRCVRTRFTPDFRLLYTWFAPDLHRIYA
jgi:hypothetical protein